MTIDSDNTDRQNPPNSSGGGNSSDRSISRRKVLGWGAAGALALPGLPGLARPRQGLLLPNQAHFASPPKQRTGTLRVANLSEPNFIDPANALEVEEYAVVRSVYDGLVQWNGSYDTLEPALALSWSSNSDATEWTFNLRPDVTFQDGTPFNSAAVKQTVMHYLPNNWGLLFSDLKTVDDSDPMVVKFTFSAPQPDLARNQTFVKIISPTLLNAKNEAKEAIGTGAFSWVNWKHGQQINLTANTNYWHKPQPYLQGLELITVQDETARVDGLVSGSLDLIMRVDAHDLPSLKSDSNVKLSGGPSWLELHLTFRCDQPLTSDRRIRQAVAYGVDRQSIVKDVLLSQGVVAPSPIPVGCYGHITPTTQYTYNPGKSRQLLKEAGYPDGISLAMVGGAPTEDLMGQAMVAQLAEAGIKVAFEIEEPGVTVADLIAAKPKHQLFILTYGWVDGGPFHFDTELVYIHPMYKGTQLINLIKQCNTTPDGPTRLNLLAQAQNLYMKEIPHLPLYYAINTDAFNSKVHGYEVPKDAYQPVFGGTYE